ncbi:MAG: methyltransferase domain-containing protein, partial [Bacillota bacterium]|nr:methyltransferase domain-containing protein [Bacillota bacterium]
VKDKINASKADNMTAVRQDINSWSQLHKNKYNIIYTSMVLHHISDLDTTQKHLYEMLTYNGYLCIIDLVEDDGSFHKDELDFKGHNGFNPDQLSKILEKLGFNSISSHVFYEGIKETEGSEIKYSLFLMTARK